MKRKIPALLLALLLMLPAAAEAAPKRYVALTFDDGPSGPLTDSLLDGLAQTGVKATFFVCGYRISQFPDSLCRIAAEGHEIGLHSCCHDYMQKMSKQQVMADLAACQQTVSEVCGVTSHLFRPPGGLYSRDLLDAAEELGLSVILWSVDPRDWDAACRRNVRKHIRENAAPGSIILMHDLSEASVQSALGAVADLQAQGYEFVTVSELARLSGCPLEPGQVFERFPAG